MTNLPKHNERQVSYKRKDIIVTCICFGVGFVILFLIFSEKHMKLLLPEVTDSSACMIVLTNPPAQSSSIYLSDRDDIDEFVQRLGEIRITFSGVTGSTIYVEGETYRILFGEGNDEAGDLTINRNNVYCGNLRFQMSDKDAEKCKHILIR